MCIFGLIKVNKTPNLCIKNKENSVKIRRLYISVKLKFNFEVANIAQKDFNKSMNNYLDKRKIEDETEVPKNVSTRWSRLKAKSKKVPEGLNEYEVHVEEKRPGLLHRIFSFLSPNEQIEVAEEITNEPEEVKQQMEEIAKDYEELNNKEDQIEHQKEGLIQRFLRLLFPNKYDDVPLYEVEATIDPETKKETELRFEESLEDIKKLSRITYFTISKLTKAKRDNFKVSEEFSEYKALLEKYKLVNKKE